MSDADMTLFKDAESDASGQSPDNFEAPNLTPEEMADHTARMVARVLEATHLFEVVEMEKFPGSFHFFGRVKKQNLKVWRHDLVKRCLVAMRFVGDGFIGTQDVVRLKKGRSADSRDPNDYDQLFGWVFSLAAKDLYNASVEICRIIEEWGIPAPKTEVREMIMLGSGPPQAGSGAAGPKGTGRRGAHPVSGGPSRR